MIEGCLSCSLENLLFMFCLWEDDDCHFGGEESWDGALPGCLLVDPEAEAGFIYNVRSIARQNVGALCRVSLYLSLANVWILFAEEGL